MLYIDKLVQELKEKGVPVGGVMENTTRTHIAKSKRGGKILTAGGTQDVK